MRWRRAEESNPHPGLFRSAGFRDQKALPSLRALRWSESRDSNPVRTVLRTVASTTSASPTWHTREELNLESQFWRLLPSPSGRVRYSRQESNLHVDARFERAASTDSATGVKLVGRGRLELPTHGAPRSERGVSTRFHHRPVSRAGLEPAKLRLSTASVCRLRHLDILVRAVGLEPT